MYEKPNLSLPEKFNEFSEARRNGFLKVRELKESGHRAAGFFCTFTPLEVLYAAGFVPVSLCGMSAETIPAAEAVLPGNLCPLIKSSFGFYISDKCPYTYFADLIVGETTCDGKKKMYEIMSQGKKTYVLKLPHGTSPEDLDFWTDEIKRFISYLEKEFGVSISDGALREAAKLLNEERSAKEELANIQKAVPSPAKGYDVYKALEGADFLFSHKDKVENLRMLSESLKKKASEEASPEKQADSNKPLPETRKQGPKSRERRILITGCPIGGVLEKTVKTVEENSAVAVCFENCTGTKTFSRKTDADAPDIVRAIAERYLRIGCSVMSPNNERLENLEKLAEDFSADAIIDISLHSCITYSVESYSIGLFAKKKGLPYLHLETDYTEGDEAQMRTRIEAFLEMI